MNSPTDEAPEDGKQRRKSIGTPFRGSGGGGGASGGLNLGGTKTRRYSIGIPSSRKSIEEEGKIVPNYLRASTGSCHDFCKYGKKHEHSNSTIPIKFKRATLVNKERVTKTEVPLERKKTTMVAKVNPLTGPKIQTPVESIERMLKTQVSKRILSTNRKSTENEVKMAQRSTSHVKPSSVMAASNGGIKKKDVKTVKKATMTPKTAVNKAVAKAAPTDSQSLKPSFSRAPSSNAIKYKNIKQVSPLKDQNRMQKTEPKKPITEKIQTKAFEQKEATEFEFICSTIEISHSFPNPSMELINTSVSDSSQSSSNKMVMEEEYESSQLFPDKELLEESSIVPPVYENSQLFPDKELLEGSSIVPPVSESSQSFSDKEVLEESSMAPPVSEKSQSSYDEEVLEDESEYTDDEEDEVSDNEEVLASENNDEMKTSIKHKKIRNGGLLISEQKDEGVKLRFRRGRILDLKSENNSPRRLKFRQRRVFEGNEDGQNVARKSFRNKNLDLQTDVDGPRRLKFRKSKVMEGNEDQERISRRTFEKKHVEELKSNESKSNHGHESVVLKHQGDQAKKDAQGLFNNVIEETASKLVETRKSKVKALVGAFETVISLQDGKPSST